MATPSFHRKDFGLALKIARIRCGLRQLDVADAIPVHETLYSRWESGDREPTPEQLQKVCRVLGVEPRDLTRAA